MSKPAQNRALTDRQQNVCELIALGLSSKEISARLGISHRTVEEHRAEVFRKMGVRNAVELARVSLSAKKEEIHG
jgi:DNA-binding NarL/FixJ family response regulator